jgi:hypothetical protein
MSEEDKFIKPIKPIFRKLRSTKERPVIKLTAGLLITYKQINEVIEKKNLKKRNILKNYNPTKMMIVMMKKEIIFQLKVKK